MNSAVYEIDTIELGILSASDIVATSVCEVTSSRISPAAQAETVYDPKMGTMQSCSVCVTCGNSAKHCPGHHGHISLAYPVIHPMFAKTLLSVLKCLCLNCCVPLALPSAGTQAPTGPSEARFRAMLKRSSKSSMCPRCRHAQPKLTYSNTENHIVCCAAGRDNGGAPTVMDTRTLRELLLRVNPTHYAGLGFDVSRAHPADMVLTVLLVMPPRSRPFVVSESMVCDDDLTLTYVEIVKISNNLAAVSDDNPRRARLVQALNFRIRSLFDNTNGKAKHSNGRAYKGIKERLSGKGGIIRQNLMGKRVNLSARTVIGPDPTLPLGWMAIPPEVAEVLTKSVAVTPFNIAELQAIVDSDRANFALCADGSRINLKYALHAMGTPLRAGDTVRRAATGRDTVIAQDAVGTFQLAEGDRVWREGVELDAVKPYRRKQFRLSIGDTVERQLVDGDVVFLNRQPTLHTGSMVAHYVRVIPGKTFRFPLAISRTFNADFDGDEMNIHAPLGVEAEAELREIASVEGNFFSPQNASTFVSIVQDGILGAYLLTARTAPLLPHMVSQLTMALAAPDLAAAARATTGRDIFSLLLPHDLWYSHAGVCIERGQLVSGTVSKAHLSGSNSSMIYFIAKHYGPRRAMQFADDVQWIANAYLAIRGFTVHLGDCIVEPHVHEEILRVVGEGFAKATELAETAQMRGIDADISEQHVVATLANTKAIGLKVAADALGFADTATDNDPCASSNFVHCVVSGSKGQMFNLAQISGLLGQQQLKGGRLVPQLANGRCSPYTPHDQPLSFEDRGFVTSSFIQGLSPLEFFQHSMTGREGVSDTALRTSHSGYMQRKVVKFSEDIMCHADGSVRDMTNRIVQPIYSGDGLNGRLMCGHNGPVDVAAIARRLASQKTNAQAC